MVLMTILAHRVCLTGLNKGQNFSQSRQVVNWIRNAGINGSPAVRMMGIILLFS